MFIPSLSSTRFIFISTAHAVIESFIFLFNRMMMNLIALYLFKNNEYHQQQQQQPTHKTIHINNIKIILFMQNVIVAAYILVKIIFLIH